MVPSVAVTPDYRKDLSEAVTMFGCFAYGLLQNSVTGEESQSLRCTACRCPHDHYSILNLLQELFDSPAIEPGVNFPFCEIVSLPYLSDSSIYFCIKCFSKGRDLSVEAQASKSCHCKEKVVILIMTDKDLRLYQIYYSK